MIVPRPALLALETALNPLLALDPQAPARLGLHAGAVLALRLEGLGAEVFVQIGEGGVLRLLERPPAEPAARVAGLPGALLRVVRGETPAACGVRIEGDLALVQALRAALVEAEPDWEEALARVTGDVVAHQLGRGLRGLARLFAHAGGQLRLDLAEYLRDETRLLADPHPVRRWSAQVDALRDDAARLEARIRRLERRAAERR